MSEMTPEEQIALGEERRDLEDPYRHRADPALDRDSVLPDTRKTRADGSGEGQKPGRPA